MWQARALILLALFVRNLRFTAEHHVHYSVFYSVIYVIYVIYFIVLYMLYMFLVLPDIFTELALPIRLPDGSTNCFVIRTMTVLSLWSSYFNRQLQICQLLTRLSQNAYG